ncbi:hypothetical protein GGI11_005813 [Coemansia sp. RSA 2049]|nr:hypothetical protein GGI11_005813 [Coemansia sp. RSA 2049]
MASVGMRRRVSSTKRPRYAECESVLAPRRRPRDDGSLLQALESLPAILFSCIFRHASGVAEVGSYLLGHLQQRHRRALSLPLLLTMIRRCSPAMAQTKRSWRRVLAPDLYRTAVYNGKTNVLMVPDGSERHVRRIVVCIPENYMSFRSMVRTMYHLPEDVRAKIVWVGLCMENNAAVSMSEYGALMGAFPNALRLSADLAHIDTARTKSLFPVLLDAMAPAMLSTLTLRHWCLAAESPAVRLVRRAAPTLEYLDLGHVSLTTIRTVLWHAKPAPLLLRDDQRVRAPAFPRLMFLCFKLADTNFIDPEWRPRVCEFPRLERMVFAIDAVRAPAPGVVGGARHAAVPRMCPVARHWLARRLLMHRLPCLTHLDMDCVDDSVVLEAGPALLPNLVHLHLLQHYHLVPGSAPNTPAPSLSRTLNAVLGVRSLRVFRSWTAFYARHVPLDLSTLSVHGLRELNISTWAIGLPDLLHLLAKLPELENIRATLTSAQAYPHPVDEDTDDGHHHDDDYGDDHIAYNVTLKHMWLDSVFGEAASWVKAPLDALIMVVAHMMNLEHLLLFTKAFLRLECAVSRKSSEDLIRLARTVHIGQCHRDERWVYNGLSREWVK